MEKKAYFIFSFSDLSRVIKQGKILILFLALLGMCGAFFYVVSHPVTYTAAGIFKGNPQTGNNRFFKALEFLGSSTDDITPSDDPRVYLVSYPVLAKVVEQLNLQASIYEPRFGQRIREAYNTLNTAYSYYHYKRVRPHSTILDSSVYVSDELITKDREPTYTCSNLHFNAETASKLTVHFLDAFHYEVFEKSTYLGKGTVDLPFSWEKGSFTLSGKGHAHHKIRLTLIPLPEAVKSLQKALKIERDKKLSNLIHIRYTHRNRKLASQIVNEAMNQFQNYLKIEGKKKITHQLAYLQQRQEETLNQLENVLQQEKSNLTSHLDEGVILSLDKELEFMAAAQAKHKHNLLTIQAEIEALTSSELPFSKWIEMLGDQGPQLPPLNLSVESAHEQLKNLQLQLENLQLEREKYVSCLASLSQDAFDTASIAKLLNDSSLNPHFETLKTLQKRLLDEKNWTAQERAVFGTEIANSRLFLQKHTEQLKEGSELHIKTLQGRIDTLHHQLLILLAERYNQESAALAQLSEQADDFPDKWIREKKLLLNTKMYQETMESITKLIEAKNIGYNLDHLFSNVLQQAKAPVFPNPPYLILKTLLGALAGAFLPLCGLCFYQCWKGPMASVSNLNSLGKKTFSGPDAIPLLGLSLPRELKLILVTAKQSPQCISSLSNWLEKREKVLIIHPNDWQVPLASQEFEKLIDSYRQAYDRVVIVEGGDLEAFNVQALLKYTSGVVYELQDDLLTIVDHLPEQTFYVQYETPLIPLMKIGPLLEDLFSKLTDSSFSKGRLAWQKRFLSKKS